MRPSRHLIFDLDGTLVDSAPVIVAVLNEMLCERRSERRTSVGELRPWLSLGGGALISTVLQVEGDELVRELADFRARYVAHRTPAACVFRGVRKGLHDLVSAGLVLGICSNKPQHLCEKVLDDVGLTRFFSVIVGSAPDLRQKPDPDLLDRAMRKLQARPSRSFLIGDSDVDHATACAAGVPFLLMSYGYAPEEWDTRQLTQFHTFAELVESFIPEQAPSLPLREAA